MLRVAAGGRSVLLTADIEAREEQALLARGAPLAADVLLAPHHGSNTSSTAAFLAAVAPADILVPAGYRNRFGHPHPAVLARYRSIGARVWRTDEGGMLRVELSPHTISISPYRLSSPRYWRTPPQAAIF